MECTAKSVVNIKSSGYKKRMRELEAVIAESVHALASKNRSLIVVFEGLDAAGKSGCIKRLTRELDLREYSVHPISKPTEAETAHHYLWRFWKRLPEYGCAAFFDRSWYGRVLVERVEKLCREDEWRRAYREINEFEKQLFDDGAVIVKLWLDVSPDEQLRRFRDRIETPGKEHKLTDEDWRNRAKTDEYIRARNDMIAMTGTGYAPWYVIPADSKKETRIASAEHIISTIDFNLQF